jgi:hypothetical protein
MKTQSVPSLRALGHAASHEHVSTRQSISQRPDAMQSHSAIPMTGVEHERAARRAEARILRSEDPLRQLVSTIDDANVPPVPLSNRSVKQKIVAFANLAIHRKPREEASFSDIVTHFNNLTQAGERGESDVTGFLSKLHRNVDNLPANQHSVRDAALLMAKDIAQNSDGKNAEKATRIMKQMSAVIRCIPSNDVAQMENHMHSIATQLSDGPVVLGERHALPHARALVLDLIAQGKVKKLFVELPSYFYKSTEPDESGRRATHKKGLSTHLRETAGTPLAKDKAWKQVKPELKSRSYPNDIPMWDLVKTAKEAGVQLYFWDKFENRENTSTKSLAERNRVGAEIFLRETQSQAEGAVLLAGFGHTFPGMVGGDKNTLQQLCGIPSERLHNLSKVDPGLIRSRNTGFDSDSE